MIIQEAMISSLDCILNVTESPWRVLRLGIIFSLMFSKITDDYMENGLQGDKNERGKDPRKSRGSSSSMQLAPCG